MGIKIHGSWSLMIRSHSLTHLICFYWNIYCMFITSHVLNFISWRRLFCLNLFIFGWIMDILWRASAGVVDPNLRLRNVSKVQYSFNFVHSLTFPCIYVNESSSFSLLLVCLWTRWFLVIISPIKVIVVHQFEQEIVLKDNHFCNKLQV